MFERTKQFFSDTAHKAKNVGRAIGAGVRHGVDRHKTRNQRKVHSEPLYSHQTTVISRIAEELGIATGDVDKARMALNEGDSEQLTGIFKVLENDGGPLGVAAEDFLVNSQTGASNLVDVVQVEDDTATTYRMEELFLKMMQRELPDAAVQIIENGNPGAALETYKTAHPEHAEDIEVFQKLARYFETKKDFKNSLSEFNDGDEVLLQKKVQYQKSILDLYRLSLDPDSVRPFEADSASAAEAALSGISRRSRFKSFLDRMDYGSFFDRALHKHLEAEGLMSEIEAVPEILMNPIDNQEHALLRNANDYADLRKMVAFETVRRDHHRVVGKSVARGAFSDLFRRWDRIGFQATTLTADELKQAYGKGHEGQELYIGGDQEIRLDHIIVDLLSGSFGINDHAPNGDPLSGTKAGAVRRLLEYHAVMKNRINNETNPTIKENMARQELILGDLIKAAADPGNTMVPSVVYDQIQHVLNNNTGPILKALIPLSREGAKVTLNDAILVEKNKLESRFDDSVSSALFAPLKHLKPEDGTLNDPEAFTTVTLNVAGEQQALVNAYSTGLSAIFSNTSDLVTLRNAIDSDPKSSNWLGVFSEVRSAKYPENSAEDILSNIYAEDQRLSIKNTGEEGNGMISALCFSESATIDESALLTAVREGGELPLHLLFADDNQPDRKLLGLSQIVDKIRNSDGTDAEKRRAVEMLIDSTGISLSSVRTRLVNDLVNPATDFNAISVTYRGATSNISVGDMINNVDGAKKRTKATVESFRQACDAADQAEALFRGDFFELFTAERDLPRVRDTLSLIGDAMEHAKGAGDFDEQVETAQEYMRQNGRDELADSFDVFVGDENFQNNHGVGSISNSLTDYIRDLGFDGLAEVIEKLFAAILGKETADERKQEAATSV